MKATWIRLTPVLLVGQVHELFLAPRDREQAVFTGAALPSLHAKYVQTEHWI